MVAQTVTLPNVRKCFIPSPGHYIADIDLAGADARVVAWDSQDEDLMDAFEDGLAIHAKNALDIFGRERAGEDGRKMPLYHQCKTAVHGTNYGGKEKAIAAGTGWDVATSRDFQSRWFDLHPNIKMWHQRVEKELLETGEIWNKWGYRRHFFERPDGLLPEALAWIGQSSVAILTNKILVAIDEALPWVKILLQVHDSIVLEFPANKWHERHKIKEVGAIDIPYDRPLNIPLDLKCSKVSWGDCKPTPWRG